MPAGFAADKLAATLTAPCFTTVRCVLSFAPNLDWACSELAASPVYPEGFPAAGKLAENFYLESPIISSDNGKSR